MRAIVLPLTLAAVLAISSAAETYVITPDGSGAFATIQQAVAAAAGNGDVIELADGVFRGAGNRDIDLLGKAVVIRSQSGDPQRTIIDCEAGPGDHHRAFEIMTGEGVNTRIEGIGITGGYATLGGGLHCSGTSPTIRTCRIYGNYAGYAGGGVYSLGAGPIFEVCILADNEAAEVGGGVHISSGGGSFTLCVFSANRAQRGGGIGIESAAVPSFYRCTLYGNDAKDGAGAYFGTGAALQMDSCIIAFNRSGESLLGVSGLVQLGCCDIFGNEGGDWVGLISGQLMMRGNFSLDPQFCSPIPDVHDNWTLQSDSPCSFEYTSCGQVGSHAVGCDDSPVETRSWGRLKAGFRDP